MKHIVLGIADAVCNAHRNILLVEQHKNKLERNRKLKLVQEDCDKKGMFMDQYIKNEEYKNLEFERMSKQYQEILLKIKAGVNLSVKEKLFAEQYETLC